MPRYGLVHLLALEEERLEIIELEVTDDAPTVGERVSDIELPEGSLIISVLRGGTGFVPKADTSIEAGDEVLLVLDPGLEEAITAYFAPSGHPRLAVGRARPPPPAARLLSFRAPIPGWCNWQHATLWMSNLGFESLSRSFRSAPCLRGV